MRVSADSDHGVSADKADTWCAIPRRFVGVGCDLPQILAIHHAALHDEADPF
jgi:hypothetical protein